MECLLAKPTGKPRYDVCIAHLADARYYPFFQRQACALRDAGYRVALVSWENAPGEGDPHWDGVDVYPITIPARSFSGKIFFARYMVRLTRMLKRLDARLYQAVDPVTLLPARLAARRNRSRYNYFSLEYFQGTDQLVGRPLTRAVWRMLENRGVARARNTGVVCDTTAERLAAALRIARPWVIHNVPAAAEYADTGEGMLRKRLGLGSNVPLVVYKGDIAAARGLEPFMRVLPEFPRVNLALIGDGPLTQRLRGVAAELSLEARVHFVGRVAPSEFAAHLRDADLGHVMHENIGLNMTITLPSRLFDYMHAGLPVLCGTGPEISGIVEEHGIGWSADPAEPGSIAAALTAFLQAREALAPYRRRALQAAQSYSWEREREVYLRYVREALGAAPDPNG
jgi:glycosyltransferase involved in cell wall biosynthesis